MDIKYTNHAQEKITERKISLGLIEEAISTPVFFENDKFDETLIHFIKKIKTRFLRVIARKEDAETLIVISAFYDRRIKRRINDDKDSV